MRSRSLSSGLELSAILAPPEPDDFEVGPSSRGRLISAATCSQISPTSTLQGSPVASAPAPQADPLRHREPRPACRSELHLAQTNCRGTPERLGALLCAQQTAAISTPFAVGVALFPRSRGPWHVVREPASVPKPAASLGQQFRIKGSGQR